MQIRGISPAITVTDHYATLDRFIAGPGQPAANPHAIQRSELDGKDADSRLWTRPFPQCRSHYYRPGAGIKIAPECGKITRFFRGGNVEQRG